MTDFAHPVEREFARILDAHGVLWQYEPRTFVLERHPDGSVAEAVTPDFYLPELDLFIETTVMKQCLTHRKNRKVRKLRELHGVDVQVLYRRDILRLARRWSFSGLERAAETGGGDPVRRRARRSRRRAPVDRPSQSPPSPEAGTDDGPRSRD